MESILTSVKKLLGIQESYTNFDVDIIMHINTAFDILNQLGVGPKLGFMIEDNTETWDQFTTTYSINMVKSYVYLKVRLLFDPPTSSVLMESMNRTIAELEWRLNAEVDVPAGTTTTTDDSI